MSPAMNNYEPLLAEYERALRDLEAAKDRVGRLEQSILSLMEERGGVGLPSAVYDCELQVSYSYDPSILVALKEVFNDADLAECYTPEHLEPVSEKWNATQIKKHARRYGDEAQAIVEKAKFASGRRLKFKKKAAKRV